jgi:hypothetical protein
LGIHIYPNPFSTELIFENLPEHEKNLKIVLTDSRGVTCIDEPVVAAGKKSIDTTRLSLGEYLFQITTKNGLLKSGKILKDRF